MIPDPRKALHLAVKEAFDAGLCIVPPREDGSKAPETYWKEFQVERASIEILRDAYRNGRTGIGIVCGVVSGQLECLDFDTKEIYGLFKQACGDAGLDELVERMEAGYSEATPHGFHLLYRPERCGGCRKLARTVDFATLIEVKAEGGYIIIAPSFGDVNANGPYVRLSGSAATIPFITLEERDALFRVAITFDRTPKVDEVPFRADIDGEEDLTKPGHDFNRRGDWSADVLKPAGWTLVANTIDREGHPQEYWRRPGKDQGNSAVLHPTLGSGGLFVCFSTSTPIPETETGYSKWRTYAWLHHGGDFGVAARELRRLDYGQKREQLVIIPPSGDEFGGMSGDAIFDLEIPNIEHLPVLGQDGFIMQGAANLLYAFPKAGKTELTAGLLREWLELDHSIVYLSEEPLFFWRLRFEEMNARRSTWAGAMFYPAMGWGIAKTLRLLEKSTADILILDTLRYTLGYQEAKGDEDVARVVVPVIQAARERGMTLVALYHARKMPGENGTDISGHHSLYGAFDRAVQLRRIDGEENDRKRRLVVSGRLLDPMGTTKLTYIMRDDGHFEALDVGTILGHTKTCEACKREFRAKRSTARFCGSTCRSQSHRKDDVDGG